MHLKKNKGGVAWKSNAHFCECVVIESLNKKFAATLIQISALANT